MTVCGVCRLCSVFFFSSRRRHTRCSRDWSSDVCSSDLLLEIWRFRVAPRESQRVSYFLPRPFCVRLFAGEPAESLPDHAGRLSASFFREFRAAQFSAVRQFRRASGLPAGFWERRLPRLYAAIHCRLPAGFVAYGRKFYSQLRTSLRSRFRVSASQHVLQRCWASRFLCLGPVQKPQDGDPWRVRDFLRAHRYADSPGGPELGSSEQKLQYCGEPEQQIPSSRSSE